MKDQSALDSTNLHSSQPTQSNWFPDCMIGSLADDGYKIVAVMARSEDFVIFLTEHGKVGFDCKRECLNRSKSDVELFDVVNSKIFNLLPAKQRRFPAFRLFGFSAFRLGNALSISFHQPDDAYGQRLIKNVESYVDDQLSQGARVSYLFSSLATFVSAAFITVLFSVFIPEHARIVQFGFLGTLGSMMSILYRTTQMKSEGFYSIFYVAMQGSMRVIAGFVFGTMAVLLIEGNIIFGFLSQTKHGIVIAAVVSGLNERFIPDTLKVMQV